MEDIVNALLFEKVRKVQTTLMVEFFGSGFTGSFLTFLEHIALIRHVSQQRLM
jgi:hypothetical protein